MMLLEVDPNLVRPGWTPLVVIVLLGVVLFFLGRSMMKQFGRIDVPFEGEVDPGPASDGTASPTVADDRAPGTTEVTAPADTGNGSGADDPRIPDLRERTFEGGRATPPDQR